jgi:hypothetical protein
MHADNVVVQACQWWHSVCSGMREHVERERSLHVTLWEEVFSAWIVNAAQSST